MSYTINFLRILLSLDSCIFALPVQVSCNFSLISRLFKILYWTFLIVSQAVYEHSFMTLVVLIILWAKTSVVHENIWITTASITLVVESGCIFMPRRGRSSFWYDAIVSLLMYAGVAHTSFINMREASIVHNGELIPSCSIAKVADVFGIKCSLQGCNCMIWLCFACEIHWF